MSKTQIDKLPGEDSFAESLERVHQAERKRLHRALARELGRPLQEWEIEFLDKYLEKVGEELDRYIVYEYGEKQVAGKLNNPDDSLLTDEESITIQTGQTYGKSANCIDTQVEQIKKEAEKNPNSLWAKGLKSFDGLDQVMENREKHQLSGETPTNTPTNTSTNGTYIRDGRLMHDLVYRGEAELTHDKRTETHGVCSDCISRQAAIDAVEKAVFKGVAKSAIESLPPVEPERPRGEWIDYTEYGYVECPFCHSATNCDGNKDELHFCFSCGADMRGEEESEEDRLREQCRAFIDIVNMRGEEE